MSLETQLNRYNLQAKAQGISSKHIYHVTSSVRYFAKFLGGISDVSKVSKDDLLRFIVALQQRQTWQDHPYAKKKRSKLSAATINTYVRGIRTFWSWLYNQRIIKTNPLAEVKAPKLPKRLPKVLNEQELARVLKVALNSDRDTALVKVLLDTGMRLDELVKLSVADVNEVDGSIKVFGKGSKERIVYISHDTNLSLQMYLIDSRPEPVSDDRLFLTHDGRPLSGHRIQKILESIGKKANIAQRLSPHKLRHSMATLSLKNGCNLEYLRRMLRHTDVKTTEIYTHIADTDVAQAHRQFSPVANLTKKR